MSSSSGGIRFDDGEAYEHFMGRWSRLAGEVFLDWLALPPGLRWADVGCGNGAFTEMLFDHAQAASVEGVDPSPGQLAFARSRLQQGGATWHLGSAMDLPFADAAFDVAVMALVIFFVPEPAVGVAEMVRVTRPGGTVAAYAWDIPGGGFPTELLAEELRRLGIEPLRPPRAEVSTIAGLEQLWTGAGLQNIQSRVIEVERVFPSLDDWWASVRGASSLAAALNGLSSQQAARLRDSMRDKLQPDEEGLIRCRAHANAITGTRPIALVKYDGRHL